MTEIRPLWLLLLRHPSLERFSAAGLTAAGVALARRSAATPCSRFLPATKRSHKRIPRLRWIAALTVLILAATYSARAQDGDERITTEQRLQELRQQILEDQQRLSEASKAEEASLQTLRNLDREIALRNELVQQYQQRLKELAAQNDSLVATLGTLEAELNELKEEYRGRAVHAYKYGRLHDLALILSANSINQMLIRVRYLNRFADQRRQRLEQIRDATVSLETRRQELQDAQLQTRALLQEAEEEQRRLVRLQQDRQRVVRQLRSQTASIERDLERKRAAASQLEQRLQELIAAESTRRRERNAANPRADLEFVELSGSFRQNRGKLPWPASGVVVEPFGDIVNPVYGTKTPNPGILIATRPQSEVRAIFDGTVIGISVLPEFGTYVAIQHGEYQSVYSNFSMVYVAEGDQVKAGQIIGRAGTDAEPKQAGIFFGLFHNGTPFDPEPWLAPR